MDIQQLLQIVVKNNDYRIETWKVDTLIAALFEPIIGEAESVRYISNAVPRCNSYNLACL